METATAVERFNVDLFVAINDKLIADSRASLFKNRSVPGLNAATAFNTAVLSVENSLSNLDNVVSITIKFCTRRRPTRIPRKFEDDVLVSKIIGDSGRSKTDMDSLHLYELRQEPILGRPGD